MADGELKRRLATILAADVVGYSKLMARDEEATIRTLKSFRAITDKLIERHDGRIFNTGGDSVLAEFGSAVEAVRSAIAIQDALRVRNAELVPERQMQFRIGINIGDVLVDGDDLLGDGVNVAARLESIASPGGICISGSTFEQVKNKLSIGFENLGAQQVKNIPEPVAAFGITTAPVSLKEKTDATAGTVNVRLAGKRSLMIGAGVCLLLLAGGAAFWMLSKTAPAPRASLPDSFSTDQMKAEEIETFMAGMKIEGRRRTDRQPFTIVLNPDKTALYEFDNADAPAGAKERIIGTWRAEDFRFCMQLRHFSSGREVCPRIVRTGGKILAKRRDDSVIPWSLTK